VSTSTSSLQDVASVDDFLNVAATETVPLFEYLEFDFLLEYDVFAPASRGRTRAHQPPDLFYGFLHCYYKDIYGTRPVARELQHGLVWYYCGLDKPQSRDTVDRFLTDLEYVIDDVFDRLVKRAAARGLLDSTYSINSTHVEAIQYNDAVKDCGLGHVRARGRVHARTEVFLALCLRLVVAITNYERGNEPGYEIDSMTGST